MTARDWAQLFRLQTVALISPLFCLGYLLAGNPFFSWRMLAWWGMGILWHITGFTMNNFFDYSTDYYDPAKRHHPHVSGAIPMKEIWEVLIALIVISLLYGRLLLRNNSLGFVLLIITVVTGFLYNLLSKRFLLAPIFIGLTYALVPLIPFGRPTPVMLAISAYLFLYLFVQTSVNGSLKDIDVDPVSILRTLGVSIRTWSDNSQTLELTTRARIYVHGLMALHILPLWYLYSHLAIPIGVIAFAIPPFVGSWAVFKFGHMKKEWDRDKILRYGGAHGALAYFVLTPIFYVPLGVWGVAFFVAVPMLWFMVFNRICWDATIGAKI